MNAEKIIIITLVVLALGGLAWSVTAFIGSSKQQALLEHTAENFKRALSAELPDTCRAPEGYTDSEWQEHVSHHPDRYAECL